MSEPALKSRSVTMAAGFTAPEGYSVIIEPAPGRVVASFMGQVIADSSRALVLRETRYAPAFYIPKDDVCMNLMKPSDYVTHCPFKGNAGYWSINLDDMRKDNIAWSYESPDEQAAAIAGHIAFYPNIVEITEVDEKDPARPGSAFALSSDISRSPLADWVIREAWDAATSRELTHRLVHQLNRIGLSLMHFHVSIGTLHPLLVANGYRWNRESDEIAIFDATYETLQTDDFLLSPIRPVLEGDGGIRRRLNNGGEIDYPFLCKLQAQGATDYVAMPMRFSDGQINAVCMATDALDGFSTRQLGMVHEVLPLLSRLFEVHAKERKAATLLRTFFGRHTGERILSGQIRRGDGESIHAVIWFCDMRDSTPIAESMSQRRFLAYLDSFFDCMAGAVIDNGGEVLRFIGDSALAIFPIGDCDDGARVGCQDMSRACTLAVKAAEDAMRRVEARNVELVDTDLPPIGFGIGLHVGNVTYGNIGVPERLEFTVIGPAANEAARIEAKSREIGKPVIISDIFAKAYPLPLVSLGTHRLRGVTDLHELFSLPDERSGQTTGAGSAAAN